MIESYEYNKEHNTMNPRVAFATAAFIISLISAALLLSVYFAIILGGIAIVMALLSRDSSGKLLPQARRAIIFGSVGLIGGYFLLVQAVISMFVDPEVRALVNQYSLAISGESFDDTIQDLENSLGIKFD
ncbi:MULTISPECIES: hypothetical protein [unclassified Butyrivibrio]|uniref:hypothetical protein n=1 Tax=unclassified Butyrivibrio TaxID=2639466 RepID=UPI00040FB4F2|nr:MULTISPECIES: hypothetical protein [unclassified Butyrivibrio]